MFREQIARRHHRRRDSLREKVAVGHLAGDTYGDQLVNRVVGCHSGHVATLDLMLILAPERRDGKWSELPPIGAVKGT